MLLKKQTVWLLTMLSLVVVLSVYYITSPDQKNNNDVAAVKQNAKSKADQSGTKSKIAGSDSNTSVSQVAGNDEFAALRLKLEDERSKLKEELNAEVASTDLPADKRSEAYDQMQRLNAAAQKEEILETLIKTMGYEDALVRADGEQVRVTVKSKNKPTPTAANQIIQRVKKEIGETNYVAVEFQPTK